MLSDTGDARAGDARAGDARAGDARDEPQDERGARVLTFP